MDEKDNIITLLNEDNEEEDFEIIMTLEVEDNEYTILCPVQRKKEGDDSAYIFKIEKEDEDSEENEDVILVPIEDDEEHKMVQDAYYTILEEEK